VLYAKNLVHGTLGALVALFVIGFYRVYFAAGTWVDALCAAVSVLVVIPILLAMGNFLSLFFPVKFHSNLKRRDKVPFAASMLGVAAASLGTAPCAMALRRVGTAGPNAATALEIFLCASVAWLIYGFSLGAATQLLESRREIVLKSVTRE
jgi:ABC-2 type transport system permease protein